MLKNAVAAAMASAAAHVSEDKEAAFDFSAFVTLFCLWITPKILQKNSKCQEPKFSNSFSSRCHLFPYSSLQLRRKIGNLIIKCNYVFIQNWTVTKNVNWLSLGTDFLNSKGEDSNLAKICVHIQHRREHITFNYMELKTKTKKQKNPQPTETPRV